jgi:hypothetical protein
MIHRLPSVCTTLDLCGDVLIGARAQVWARSADARSRLTWAVNTWWSGETTLRFIAISIRGFATLELK